MNGLYILHHLGLGDAVICNAIYRLCADRYPIVVLPVKYHNVSSVQFMLRDLENILIRPVEDDGEMVMFRDHVWKGDIIGLGGFSRHRFDGEHWDKSFFDQVFLPFEERWTGWKCERDKQTEIGTSDDQPYRFVHDDSSRGFKIEAIDDALRTVRPHQTQHIFQWWNMIEHAQEIHCISSSFAHFVDSIPLPKKPKLFLHVYCRAGEALPTMKKEWQILR